ncbi:DUF2793 domain-containing protein [Paracoccus aerodenitrificans]|uniref:DUF2793 domain-containing protein n=1 Tax=Paracoccus aerodenitrificans TaxID=3017781 RepID=UPI0022F0CCC3|nr:DUF2793 domain-containing protein [Paracoccus aerodenitrificans]WBU65348.1 DUF2793 domain-containing protein [Paracoccus aerodenitrificans]
MTDHATSRFSLPLVQASQAQKHVTVNESLARLDGLVNLVLNSVTQHEPPLTAAEGACFAVPPGASGAWAGQEGRIAIASNGGWVFVAAQAGMRGFIADQGVQAIHDGSDWVPGALTLGLYGSALAARMAETEIAISAGGAVVTDLLIPNAAMVIGATARVTEEITGSLESWRMGTEGATDRFGSLLGTGAGSWARGMLSQPVTYWQPSPVILTATGGMFTGGRVRIAVHWLELTLPS